MTRTSDANRTVMVGVWLARDCVIQGKKATLALLSDQSDGSIDLAKHHQLCEVVASTVTLLVLLALVAKLMLDGAGLTH